MEKEQEKDLDFQMDFNQSIPEVVKTGEKNFVLPEKNMIQFPGDDEEEDLTQEGLDKDNCTIPRSISPDLVLERIDILIVKMSENLKNKVFPGIHPEFNAASPDLAKRTRGSVLMATLNFTRYLVQNNLYWSYRELLYFCRGYLSKLAKNIPWLQMRPNVRILEKILQLQSHSLPFYGRPRGLIALGKQIFLKCGDSVFVRPGFLSQLPLGDHSVKQLESFTSDATMIVYCESHAEVHRLVGKRILESQVGSKIIIITSSGNPDRGFRMVLSKLSSDLKVPVKSLTDCDLGGFLTLCTLRFGTFGNFRKDPEWLLTPEIEPIGIVPGDILDTDRHVVPLTKLELDSLSTLKAKWTSHGLVLPPEDPLEQILEGFIKVGKTMSMAQMNLNCQTEDFSCFVIIKAGMELEETL